MEIQIFGHTDLEKFLNLNKKQYDVICYTPSAWSELDFVQDHAVESLHLPVDDVDHYNNEMCEAPSASVIRKFLEFSKNRKKLLVACRAGICRSSATAYIVAARAWGPEAALEILQKPRHFPNRLIVYIGSRVLGDTKIWTKYCNWMREWSYDPSQRGIWPNTDLISKMGL